eukprot:NODE_746_length_4249_cov_0.268916.p3 type:complete len:181 gc:universal NODE_746_length_4249_cov_0.268916:141-683(+)
MILFSLLLAQILHSKLQLVYRHPTSPRYKSTPFYPECPTQYIAFHQSASNENEAKAMIESCINFAIVPDAIQIAHPKIVYNPIMRHHFKHTIQLLSHDSLLSLFNQYHQYHVDIMMTIDYKLYLMYRDSILTLFQDVIQNDLAKFNAIQSSITVNDKYGLIYWYQWVLWINLLVSMGIMD